MELLNKFSWITSERKIQTLNDFQIIQKTTKNLKNNMTEKYNIGFAMHKQVMTVRGGTAHTKNGLNTPLALPLKKTPSAPTFTNQNFPGPPFCNFFTFFQVPLYWRGCLPCKHYRHCIKICLIHLLQSTDTYSKTLTQ